MFTHVLALPHSFCSDYMISVSISFKRHHFNLNSICNSGVKIDKIVEMDKTLDKTIKFVKLKLNHSPHDAFAIILPRLPQS